MERVFVALLGAAGLGGSLQQMWVLLCLRIPGSRALPDLCSVSSRELYRLWSHLFCAEEEGESSVSPAH